MKFNIITTAYNSEETILNCYASIERQNFKDIKWIIIDGKSKDKTVNIIKENKKKVITSLTSEKDKGLYFGYNKGLKKVNANNNTIINILDSDNEYIDKNVLKNVYNIFKKFDVDIVFSDIIYVTKKNKILRFWKSKPFKKYVYKKNLLYIYKNFSLVDYVFGWTMPLPSIFIKSNLAKKIGLFETRYRVCSDYNWSLRAGSSKDVKIAYINKVLVKMRAGGVSNRFSNLVRIKLEDFMIIFNFLKKKNLILAFFLSPIIILFKNLRKIPQFFFRG
jgi:glycosyltransferase